MAGSDDEVDIVNHNSIISWKAVDVLKTRNTVKFFTLKIPSLLPPKVFNENLYC